MLKSKPTLHNLRDARRMKEKKNIAYNKLTCYHNESSFINRILERQHNEIQRKHLNVGRSQTKKGKGKNSSSQPLLIIHRADSKVEVIERLDERMKEIKIKTGHKDKFKSRYNCDHHSNLSLQKTNYNSSRGSGGGVGSGGGGGGGVVGSGVSLCTVRSSTIKPSTKTLSGTIKNTKQFFISQTSLAKSMTTSKAISAPNLRKRLSLSSAVMATRSQKKIEQQQQQLQTQMQTKMKSQSQQQMPILQHIRKLIPKQDQCKKDTIIHKLQNYDRCQQTKTKLKLKPEPKAMPKVKVCDIMCKNQSVCIPFLPLSSSATVTPKTSFIMPAKEFGIKPFHIKRNHAETSTSFHSKKNLLQLIKADDDRIKALPKINSISQSIQLNEHINDNTNALTMPMPSSLPNELFKDTIKLPFNDPYQTHRQTTNKCKKGQKNHFDGKTRGKKLSVDLRGLPNKTKYRIHKRYVRVKQVNTKKNKRKTKRKAQQSHDDQEIPAMVKNKANSNVGLHETKKLFVDKIKSVNKLNEEKTEKCCISGNCNQPNGKIRLLTPDEIQNMIENGNTIKKCTRIIEPSDKCRLYAAMVDKFKKSDEDEDDEQTTSTNTVVVKKSTSLIMLNIEATESLEIVEKQCDKNNENQNLKLHHQINITGSMNKKRNCDTETDYPKISSTDCSSDYHSLSEQSIHSNRSNKMKAFDRKNTQNGLNQLNIHKLEKSNCTLSLLERRQRRIHKLESYDERSTSEISLNNNARNFDTITLHHRTNAINRLKTAIMNDTDDDNTMATVPTTSTIVASSSSTITKSNNLNTLNKYSLRANIEKKDNTKEIILLKAPRAHSNTCLLRDENSSDILSINRSKIFTNFDNEFSKRRNYSKERIGFATVDLNNILYERNGAVEKQQQRLHRNENDNDRRKRSHSHVGLMQPSPSPPIFQQNVDIRQTNRSIYSMAQSVNYPFMRKTRYS